MIRAVLAIAGFVFGGCLIAGQQPAGSLRINTTASMPIGVWTVADLGAVTRGQAVVFCLPGAAAARAMARGYIGRGGDCPDGSEALLKPIVAVAGDLVALGPAGVSVNGEPIADSAVLPADRAGRPVAAAAGGTVAPGTVWLMSGHDRFSFDSRYFGAVPVANLRGAAFPLAVSR